MAEHAPPVTVRDMPDSGDHPRIQISISTPREFVAFYLEHGTAYALLHELAAFFSGEIVESDDTDPGDAA